MDFGKLEKELHAAITAEERYWRENDAKFRAVNQKVETYEEFRDIVLASHLKPLEKGDRMDAIKNFEQPWNIHASKVKDQSRTESTEIKQNTKSIPKDGQEFFRDWKRYYKTTEDQYKFLIQIGGEQLKKIFRAEISYGLLGDIIKALQEHFCDSDSLQVIEVLESLTHANRFSLSVQFLSSKEKSHCVDVLKNLKTYFSDQGSTDMIDRLLNLEKLYEVKI
ncbi:hypothetical protein KUTeg_002080 [Tegillarca granosa]|uniref:Coiled-coil domain-containing protein 103 n=1 Tax=Tegillarca granosa TaxID=220873 RepID=A0ABQ9FTB0_TEGGR|nr:hypothetical protein KUTeg_002080 [Tegillarca granosa]